MLHFTLNLFSSNLFEAASSLLVDYQAFDVYRIEEEKTMLVGGSLQQIDKKEIRALEKLGDFKILKNLEIDWNEQWEGNKKEISIEGMDRAVNLLSGPGFGDNSHPSTQIMLELIQGESKEARVLDVGCGSGILSCCALALGASYVYALDVDKQALNHCRENIRANKFPEDRFEVRREINNPKAFLGSTLFINMIEVEQKQVFDLYREFLPLLDTVIFSGILLEDVRRYEEELFYCFFNKQDWREDDCIVKEIWVGKRIKKRSSVFQH
jgi:ribosomal protein L11 methyltransferase